MYEAMRALSCVLWRLIELELSRYPRVGELDTGGRTVCSIPCSAKCREIMRVETEKTYRKICFCPKRSEAIRKLCEIVFLVDD